MPWSYRPEGGRVYQDEASYVDFSTTIDGYTPDEDHLSDWTLENIGECENCGLAATEFCRCSDAERDMERWGVSEGDVFSIYRLDAETDELDRARRQRKRQHLMRIRFWQKVVLLIRIVSFWRNIAAIPDCKAAQSASKRFKRNIALHMKL